MINLQVATFYLAAVLVLSAIAFGLYGLDKRRARLDQRRIPESTLHLVGLVGGWPGALAGQRVFRHKTRKVKFQVWFWLSVTCHLVFIASMIYLFA